MNWIRSSLNGLVLPSKVLCNNIIGLLKYFDIRLENQILHEEIETLKLKIASLQNTSQKLMELKKSMKISFPDENLSSIGKVLGYDKSFFESFLIIAVNSTECAQGSVVISTDGLIGIIHDIHRDTARVRTITDNQIFIPVITRSGEKMILTGNCSKNIESIEYNDQHTTTKISVNIGDVLYTSGEGGVFPINIPVAKVVKIDRSKKKIIAEPIIDFKHISYVWIVNPVVANNLK
ncbi:MAG: rod shape-determining protein MreC [Holosporales bacterium]|nr:rod shape-determining protein MreC [Holosporales bacterium]